jgi:hypothetical protein
MENNNISKAIRSILEEGQAVTVKQVLETLQSEHSITAEYRPVFGTLRRIANGAGKGTFQGLKKASKTEAVVAEVIEAPVMEIEEEAVVAVEEAPMKKAAKRKRKK